MKIYFIIANDIFAGRHSVSEHTRYVVGNPAVGFIIFRTRVNILNRIINYAERDDRNNSKYLYVFDAPISEELFRKLIQLYKKAYKAHHTLVDTLAYALISLVRGNTNTFEFILIGLEKELRSKSSIVFRGLKHIFGSDVLLKLRDEDVHVLGQIIKSNEKTLVRITKILNENVLLIWNNELIVYTIPEVIRDLIINFTYKLLGIYKIPQLEKGVATRLWRGFIKRISKLDINKRTVALMVALALSFYLKTFDQYMVEHGFTKIYDFIIDYAKNSENPVEEMGKIIYAISKTMNGTNTSDLLMLVDRFKGLLKEMHAVDVAIG